MDHKSIGEYELEREIGTGTVGRVFRARHRETGQVVALKMLNARVANDRTVEQRFVREVSVLQKLDHENIVEYDFCGLHEDILFFTMENIDSGSLKEMLTGPVPWRDAVDLGIQVCDAIEHAHENGVVHRDLKPANLFLSAEGRVKVGDFGIALDVDRNRLTAEGQTVGTRRYMAPEQITADEVGPQADIYSLGCILFEMMAGRVPFDAESDIQIIEQHLEVSPPKVRDLNPLCPKSLNDLIDRALAKDPEDRPAGAAELRRELMAIGTPVAEESTGEDLGSTADDGVATEQNLTERLQQNSTATPMNASWSTLAVMMTIVVGAVVAIWALSQQS